MQINVAVTDSNNIVCEVVPPQTQTITIDRGVAGNGIVSIVPVTISTFQYLRITYTNGTVQDVGPLTSTAYTATAPITIVGNTISLATVPIASGGTDATTAAGAIQNLLPSYTGNANKRLGLNSGGTALEWVADGGGTVTSVAASGGTTGLTFTGSPITTSGTLTLSGTLAVANGGTGVTTSTGTGNVVLSAAPTFSGTASFSAISASSTITGNGNWVIGNADTDTITQGASYVTGTKLRSAKVATNTLALSAYDVDGAAYVDLITLTASNTPTLTLTSTGLGTINNMSIGATTPSTGAFTTLTASTAIDIASGGTGQTTAQAAMNSFAGAVTSGSYLRGNGTNVVMSTIQAADVPTLNQNTTGTAANITGIVAIANGGTGQTTANAALNALLPTQTGNASKYLQTDGTNSSWDAISLSTADITGILPTANGGTGLSSFTSGGVVYASSTNALATNSAFLFDGTSVTASQFLDTGFTLADNTDITKKAVFELSGLTTATTRTYTLPDATTTLAGLAVTQTFSATQTFSGSVTMGGNTNSCNIGTSNTTGLVTIGGTSGTGILTLGRSTVSQTTNIQAGATASASTKTINFGTGGLSGSTTAINIGSSVSGASSTTTLNGTVTLANALATTSGGTGLTSFTSGGVVYASSTSALATGSALTFDGTSLGVGTTSPASLLAVAGSTSTTLGLSISAGGWNNARHRLTVPSSGDESVWSWNYTGSAVDSSSYGTASIGLTSNVIKFATATTNTAPSEQMRLTSTGLGIGTSSPDFKLVVAGNTDTRIRVDGSTSAGIYFTQGGSNAGTIRGTTSGLQLYVPSTGLAATLDSSGNLGIGISSPAQKLHVDQTLNGSVWAKISNGSSASGAAAGVLFGSDGGDLGAISILSSGNSPANALFLRSLSTNPLVFGTNNAEKMRLDSSGNLGLGVTPSAWSTGYKALQVNTTASISATSSAMRLSNNGYVNTGGTDTYLTTAAATTYIQGSGQHAWYTAPSGTAGNAITFTQAMSLDANGRLNVGATSFGFAVRAGFRGDSSSVATVEIQNESATGTMLTFRTNGESQVGSVSFTSSAVLYNVTSDQRLKNDLGAVKSTDVIANTVIHDFTWKSDGSQARGVFAQEAAKVIPSAVKVGNDGEEVIDQWQVDYSKYVPDIIVELQALRARVAKLEAK